MLKRMLILGVVVACCRLSKADDWPGFRGPDGNGVAPLQSLPLRWDEETNIRWRVDVPGRSHGSPIVVGDRVYLTTAIDDQQKQSVVCLDRRDGSLKWTRLVHEGGFPPLEDLHVKASNGNGTIASNGTSLFIAFLNGPDIHATSLDLDGNIRWQKKIGRYDMIWGYGPSPVLYESMVIFTAESLAGGYLSALDVETGQTIWTTPREKFVTYSTPIIATVGGREQLVLSGGESITSYDPRTGKQLWKTHCPWKSTCGMAIAGGNLICASGGYPVNQTVCLNGDGEVLWTNQINIYEPSLLILKDDILAVRDDGVAFLWEGATGRQKWKKRLTSSVSASPVLCGDRIMITSLNGETIVMEVGDPPKTIAKNQLGDECFTSHAISDGEIFLRVAYRDGDNRREQVVCIAEDEPAGLRSRQTLE